MTTADLSESAASARANARSRAVGTAGTTALLGALLVWGVAEAIKASDIKEKTFKSQVTLVVALLTVVQLGLMAAISRAKMPRRLMLTRMHRGVGMTTLVLAGVVTYLCFTAPFRTGVTTHRVAGFVVCTAALVKITFARTLTKRWYFTAMVGLILMAGLQVAFFTKAYPVLFRGK